MTKPVEDLQPGQRFRKGEAYRECVTNESLNGGCSRRITHVGPLGDAYVDEWSADGLVEMAPAVGQSRR